ncbi:MAG: hypothetical protein HY651_06620 [Acidobacteria bacterium]|nr:hypothetical protein [Acidobacteriota bacterium]
MARYDIHIVNATFNRFRTRPGRVEVEENDRVVWYNDTDVNASPNRPLQRVRIIFPGDSQVFVGANMPNGKEIAAGGHTVQYRVRGGAILGPHLYKVLGLTSGDFADSDHSEPSIEVP